MRNYTRKPKKSAAGLTVYFQTAADLTAAVNTYSLNMSTIVDCCFYESVLSHNAVYVKFVVCSICSITNAKLNCFWNVKQKNSCLILKPGE